MDGTLRRITLILLLACTTLAPAPANAGEPTVDQVRTAALQYTGLHRSTDRWSARSRWRNLLPRVTAYAGWLEQTDDTVQFDEYLSRDGDGNLLFDRAHNGNDHDERARLNYTVRATVDLAGLIFDRAELSAAREERARITHRQQVIEAVHDAYFRRLALRDELQNADPTQRRELALAILRLEARLDGLTGGWFRRELEGGAR